MDMRASAITSRTLPVQQEIVCKHCKSTDTIRIREGGERRVRASDSLGYYRIGKLEPTFDGPDVYVCEQCETSNPFADQMFEVRVKGARKGVTPINVGGDL